MATNPDQCSQPTYVDEPDDGSKRAIVISNTFDCECERSAVVTVLYDGSIVYSGKYRFDASLTPPVL